MEKSWPPFGSLAARKSHHGNIQKTASRHQGSHPPIARGETLQEVKFFKSQMDIGSREVPEGEIRFEKTPSWFFVEKNTWKMIYQAKLVSCSETTLVCITPTYQLQGSKILVEGRLWRIKDSPVLSFNLMDFPWISGSLPVKPKESLKKTTELIWMDFIPKINPDPHHNESSFQTVNAWLHVGRGPIRRPRKYHEMPGIHSDRVAWCKSHGIPNNALWRMIDEKEVTMVL